MSFKRRFILRIVESATFISVVCGVIWFVLHKFNFNSKLEVLTVLNISDMYYTQISVSFIIISLVSVLTNSSKPVYWVDITQYKLIEPKHTAFIDFAAYILSALIVSSSFLIFNSNYLLISFGFSIIYMMLLTIKMIGAFFGRDSVKVELQKVFQSLKDDAFAELGKSNAVQKKINRRQNKRETPPRQAYAEICSELEDKTYKEIDNKEYNLVSENIDLLVSNDEYDTFIDILKYISENMVNIYCKYVKKYYKSVMSYKPNNYSQDHQNRFFQLVYTSLLRSIEKNDLQEVSVCLYSILLKGRNAQFTMDELKNKRYYTRGRYWKRIEPALSIVYNKCINEDKYELLDAFLYAFYKEQLAFRRMLCRMNDRSTEVVGKLYALYVDNLGLETILQGLAHKVDIGQIDYRQVNMLIHSLTVIYHEIETNREKNKDALNAEQASKIIYDESFVQLIELAYKNMLLDNKTMNQYAVMVSSELQAIYYTIIQNNT